MGSTAEMQTYAARLESFEQTHQIAKRRTSNNRKAKQSVEWPHNTPTGIELARAGFYYRPAQDSTDNVQCFVCSVKLDGWEPNDSPLLEHIAHSSNCAWATALSVARDPDAFPSQEPETRDPLSDELISARQATFDVGNGWPHDSKKGWKCKSDKLVEAGWVFDPSPDADDGVTCFYCGLSLDGWEPKDNPFEEHQRRSTECPFFELIEQYDSFRAVAKGSKTKAKGKKGRGRASSASRQSGISQASVRFSDTLSFSGMEAEVAAADDSIMTTGTTSSKMSGRPKKSTKAKTAPKKSKTKKTSKTDDESAMAIEYPDLNLETSAQERQVEEEEPKSIVEVQSGAPAKSTKKKGARNSKQVESSVLDTSATSEIPSKKGARGRKPKQQPEPEPEPEEEAIDVSLQLQQELERSTFSDMSISDAEAESTPQPQQKSVHKRGIKRASDGARKDQIETSIVSIEFPLPPKTATTTAPSVLKDNNENAGNAQENKMAVSLQLEGLSGEESLTQQSDLDVKAAKPTRGRPKKKAVESIGHEHERSALTATDDASQEIPTEEVVTKKGRGRPKKINAADSREESPATRQNLLDRDTEIKASAEIPNKSKSKRNAKAKKGGSKSNTSFTEAATVSESLQASVEVHEDNSDQDEQEIQAELMRIAAEQEANYKQERERSEAFEVLEMEAEVEAEDENNIQVGAEESSNEAQEDEFEPTPSRRESKRSRRDSGSSWQEAETSTPRVVEQPPQIIAAKFADATPSPAGSDKENLPSSIAAPQTAVKAQPILSPTKTLRIPLAPGTPNRSPSRIPMLSPSKQQFSALSSTQPWEAIDLDAILLTTASSSPSDEASPGKVGNALAQAAGMLTSPEKKMSVEEWIRWRAGKGEEDLRKRCESLVGVFEREGNKALGCLEGIVVQS